MEEQQRPVQSETNLSPLPEMDDGQIKDIRKRILIFGAIASVLLVIAWGVVTYFAKVNYDKVSAEAQKAQQEIVALKQKRAQDDPTANWQIYRNEEYGFEFKYPREWHNIDLGGQFTRATITSGDLNSDNSAVKISTQGYCNIDIEINNSVDLGGLDLYSYLDNLNKEDNSGNTLQDIKIGTDEGVLLVDKNSNLLEKFVFYKISNTSIMGIIFNCHNREDSLFNSDIFTKILSTFRFTK